jgi:hypothetical protein
MARSSVDDSPLIHGRSWSMQKSATLCEVVDAASVWASEMHSHGSRREEGGNSCAAQGQR